MIRILLLLSFLRFEKEADIFSEIYCMKSSEYKLYGYKFLYSKYEIQPIVKQDDFQDYIHKFHKYY